MEGLVFLTGRIGAQLTPHAVIGGVPATLRDVEAPAEGEVVVDHNEFLVLGNEKRAAFVIIKVNAWVAAEPALRLFLALPLVGVDEEKIPAEKKDRALGPFRRPNDGFEVFLSVHQGGAACGNVHPPGVAAWLKYTLVREIAHKRHTKQGMCQAALRIFLEGEPAAGL